MPLGITKYSNLSTAIRAIDHSLTSPKLESPAPPLKSKRNNESINNIDDLLVTPVRSVFRSPSISSFAWTKSLHRRLTPPGVLDHLLVPPFPLSSNDIKLCLDEVAS
jgi:hypothetical protein